MLKDEIMKLFEECKIKLVDGIPNLWRYVWNGVLRVCEKKRDEKGKRDTWLWNEEVKEDIKKKIYIKKGYQERYTQGNVYK